MCDTDQTCPREMQPLFIIFLFTVVILKMYCDGAIWAHSKFLCYCYKLPFHCKHIFRLLLQNKKSSKSKTEKTSFCYQNNVLQHISWQTSYKKEFETQKSKNEFKPTDTEQYKDFKRHGDVLSDVSVWFAFA